MSYSSGKRLIEAKGKYFVEFSEEDELYRLIDENTYRSGPRAVSAAIRCLTLIAGGSSLKSACKLSGVPWGTLAGWRSKPWYEDAIRLIQKQLDDQLDGKLTHTINKAVDRLHDRLDNGDAVLQKDGSLAYKPVAAKDAAIITSIFFDKRNLLRNKPTSISSSQSIDDRLEGLAKKFKEIAQEADGVLEDAEYTEIVIEEPESEPAGLEGTQGQEQECPVDEGTSERNKV